jgi:apolipoprotein N-acyltransferase
MGLDTTFQFTIIRNPRKEISWITILLVVMNVLALVIMGFSYPEKRWLYWLLSLAIFVFLALQYKKKPVNTPLRMGFSFFFLMGIPWASTEYWWLLVIALMMSLLEYLLHSQHKLLVNENGIHLQRWPNKQWGWNEIEFAVLKDGILTWALLNEKTIQTEVEMNESYSESTFNAFVTSMKS